MMIIFSLLKSHIIEIIIFFDTHINRALSWSWGKNVYPEILVVLSYIIVVQYLQISALERGRKVEELQKRLVESEMLRTRYNRKVALLKDQVC
jgi:hypothetical protein